MNILCLFAGQGFQQQNLFEVFKNNQQALDLVQEFSKRTSMDLLQTHLPIADPSYSQLIIGAYQLILFRMLEPLLANHQLDCAGYSLGEVSAFLASTYASTSTTYQVLSYRTQLMASIFTKEPIEQYDLLFVVGTFTLEAINELCHRYECFIAIINLQYHLVIGGTVTNLQRLQLELPSYKVKQSKFLNIHLPSHTPFYQDKKGLFHQFLASMDLNRLYYPLFSPIKLTKIYDSTEEQQLLDQELYTCLQWGKVCDLISEYQYDLIIDLGPGQSMTSLLNRTSTNSKLISVAQYKSIDGIIGSIARQINL